MIPLAVPEEVIDSASGIAAAATAHLESAQHLAAGQRALGSEFGGTGLPRYPGHHGAAVALSTGPHSAEFRHVFTVAMSASRRSRNHAS